MSEEKSTYESLLELAAKRPAIELMRHAVRRLTLSERAALSETVTESTGGGSTHQALLDAIGLLCEDIRSAADEIEHSDLHVDSAAERITWLDDYVDLLRIAVALLPINAVEEPGEAIADAEDRGACSTASRA